MTAARRKRLPGLVLVAAVTWSASFAVVDSYRTVRLYMNRPWTEEVASTWRLGSPPVEALRELLHEIDERLDGRARLSIAAPRMTEAEAYYLHKWAAYLLPEHDVYPLGAERTREIDYRLVWLETRQTEDLEVVATFRSGTLYRLP